MQRRSYTAEEKTKFVLELIRGEHEVNAIALRDGFAPNLLRNWKSEFMDNATLVFDQKRDQRRLNQVVLLCVATHVTCISMTAEIPSFSAKLTTLLPEYETVLAMQGVGKALASHELRLLRVCLLYCFYVTALPLFTCQNISFGA